MRRFAGILFTALLVICLSLGAFAATGATGVSSNSTVSSDGSCHVTLTATLHLDSAMDDLRFPVPVGATDITVNGSRARTSKDGEVRQIDLSRILGQASGDFSISISYSLKDVIYSGETGLEMQLPLLSGFSYPVESMSFTVTLPGALESRPAFSSGYHQADIEKDMSYVVSGNTVTGKFSKALKDHETLLMVLPVTEEMFPQNILNVQESDVTNLAVLICAALALVYWLIFLRNLPPRRKRNSLPPEGFAAGELGSIVACRGRNLNLMVLTWAQLGYLLIKIDRQGNVILHKRMDMGNERSEWEQRCFRKLFGSRKQADTHGTQYAELCRLVSKKASLRELKRSRFGNLQIFRILASGIGFFGGVDLAIALSGGAALQGLLIVLFAVLGGLCGWFVQGWAYSLFLWDRSGLWYGLSGGGILLFLGLISGQFLPALYMVLGLFVAGLLLAVGGRRTKLGRDYQGQVLDLRRYLWKIPKGEFQRICAGNPDYFFQLAPCALALGVHKQFARQFGSAKLSCGWINLSTDQGMTAFQWSQVMEHAVNAMSARSRHLPLEKLLGLLQGLRK